MAKEDQANTAVCEGTEKPPAPAKASPKANPKKQPPYAVVVLDDDQHTFQYVIEVLQKTFGYDLAKAFKLTLQIHTDGRSVVWSGPMETAEFKRDRVRGFGPDTYAASTVTFPLGCIIEPLPG